MKSSNILPDKELLVPLKTTGCSCYHCGLPCTKAITTDSRFFCCQGCKQVYMLLSSNHLCDFYTLSEFPAIKPVGKFVNEEFAYLDDVTVINKLAKFQSLSQTNVVLSLPGIHCASCIFLLEYLSRISEGIIASRVNFLQKEIFISFEPAKTSLRKVVELLSFLGYPPFITLEDLNADDEGNKKAFKASSKKRIQLYRIGTAGFCFANIMMLSFPEYLSGGNIETGLKTIFVWLIFLLSIPVLIFCAPAFFMPALKSIRGKFISIDAPIALAILVTFARSYFEILSGQGVGFLDSGSGIVFFMLIGRWFQEKTQVSMTFDRDYRSYFPLGVTVIKASNCESLQTAVTYTTIPVTKLTTDDQILVHHLEMIPCDGILLKGDGLIDYSFVNGENIPQQVKEGQRVYAGGKQVGKAIEVKVCKNVSQSYITELWNNNVFSKKVKQNDSFIHAWSQYFTVGLFIIALITMLFWWIHDSSKILTAFCSVLIVACPCSILLADSFTKGNMLRIMGRNKLYLKNAAVIDTMAQADTIVFDKTGTLTETKQPLISFEGNILSDFDKQVICKVSSQSSHPLSRFISAYFKIGQSSDFLLLQQFVELAGNGIIAVVNGVDVKIGSPEFVGEKLNTKRNSGSDAIVYVSIDHIIKGYFTIRADYRNEIQETIANLKKMKYNLHVLSGDHDTALPSLRLLFGKEIPILFRQLPADKLNYIAKLQASGKKVIMLGDGLNDAGALKQANVGIAVNNEHSLFTPASDAIIDGNSMQLIARILSFSRSAKPIVASSFIISLLYNIIGLSFAVSGTLSPIIAAILMPISSVTSIVLVTTTGSILAKYKTL